MESEISIIVPVYNAAPFLDECICSILTQTFTNFELILCPGKSTDNSTEICYAWAQKDSRIKIVNQDKNNCAYARNKAIKNARGKYIAFCDADDAYCKDYLQKMYSMIESSDSDIVECMFYVADENMIKKEIYDSLSLNREFGHDMEERQGPPSIWKYMVKKSVWINNNILFPEISKASDLAVYSLVFSLCERKSFLYEPLYVYRLVCSSLTHSGTSYENAIMNAKNLCEFITSEFKRRGIYEEHKMKLISQIEHHLSLNVSEYGMKDYYTSVSLLIKKSYGVKYTLFDLSVFGWGGNDIQPLCAALRKSRLKEINYVENTSMCQLNNSVIKQQFNNVLHRISADVIVIDLLSEVELIRENLNSVSEYIRAWAIGCNVFFSVLLKEHADAYLILVEKYLPDTNNNKSINEILELMYDNIQSVNKLIKRVSLDTRYNSISAEYEQIYFYEAIADFVHSI